MISKQVLRHYNCLRKTWNESAGMALRMAKARVQADHLGIEFEWREEQENPRDVFGEPDEVNGPFYDPKAEFWACVAKDSDGNVLDSLGMIDGAFNRTDNAGYHYYVECEMAESAVEQAEEKLDAKRRAKFSEIFARMVKDLSDIPEDEQNRDLSVRDLIVDLIHVSDLYKVDFETMYERASEVYQAED